MGTIFNTLLNKIRNRKRAHVAPKSADETARFIADLNQALVPLAEPDKIMESVVKMVGEYLHVDRCGYAEVDKDQNLFTVRGDYVRGGASSIVGQYQMSGFGDRERQVLFGDCPYIVNDIEAESPPGTDLSLYQRGGIRALLCVPLRKGSNFVARIAVQQSEPRHWTENEILLLTTVADRCWESVERARALKVLKESDERYRAFIKNSSEAIWRFELEQPIPLSLSTDEQMEMMFKYAYLAECNEAMARMYGYASAGEIIGARLLDLMVRSDPQNVAMLLKLADNGFRLTDFETHELDRYGNTKYFLNNMTAILENDAVVRAWGTQRDITEQKRAEGERERLSREVEAERDRLKRILEQMPIGVAIATAPSGQNFFHNPEAVRLLRHPLSTVGISGYGEYGGALHEDGSPYRPEEYPLARSLMSEEVIKGEEMRYRRGDGTETVLSVDSAPIYDSEGHLALAVVTFIDIAARRRAEEDLRESEERFSKAFRATPDSLVISRIADGVVLEANDSFLSIAGYKREEVVGKSTLSLGMFVDPATRQRAVALMQEQKFVHDLEFAMKTKSGQVRLMMFSAQPLEIRGEHCWLTIGRDISEQRQAEQERERLLLQEKVAREEAEAANRMKDEVLATISHELRTPLTAILGWAQVLTTGEIPEAQARHALEVIEKNAKSQARLIDDILDTSRIITGRLRLDPQPIAVDAVFQAALEVVRPSAEAKRMSLGVSVDDHGSVVFGDAVRLQQVIWNLLSNAVKFTNAGGHVDARLRCTNDQCEISISDTGVGIEPQFLPYVFERFRQADNTSTRRYGGLGLGLAIVRHLVELHGGRVSASSSGPNQGSTFTVTLPLGSPLRLPETANRPPESESRPAAPSSVAENGARLDRVRVLVVDDDSDTLEMLHYVLRERGATVMTAPSASTAMKTMEQWRPDVVVCDIAMPDQDGYELIAELRSLNAERGGNVPAVALTAYARPEDRAQALAAGFQMHVAKPVDPDELIAVLASLTRGVHI
jgi:PAS domain S-box-containing protein